MGEEWMAQLSDEYKQNETLKSLGGITQLAKSYLDLKAEIEKSGGLKPYKIPGSDAPPETKAEFLKALGVPEKEEEYDINPFDVDTEVKLDDIYLSLKKTAKAANLSKEQAKQVSKWHADVMKKYLDRATETIQNKFKETDEVLRKEWGSEYEERKLQIGRMLKDVPEDKMEYLRNKGMTNDPVFISILGQLAKKTGEHVFVSGSSGVQSLNTGIQYKNMDKYKST